MRIANTFHQTGLFQPVVFLVNKHQICLVCPGSEGGRWRYRLSSGSAMIYSAISWMEGFGQDS